MKQRIFTFLLIALVAGITACRKSGTDPDINEYDEQQIKAYISANNLEGFTRDAEGFNDTSGIYYKILEPGRGDRIQYSDKVSLVFSLKSFDGKYSSVDTITNHVSDYVGLLASAGRTKGLQLGIHNLLKYKGGSMRMMIPSHLAYGVSGIGSGSVTNVNTRIAGNQSLDYFVRVIDNQDVYDEAVIKRYLNDHNLTGYAKDPKGYWYKVITPGTGPAGEIKQFSKVYPTYVGSLLNGAEFDAAHKTTVVTEPFVPGDNLTEGVADAFIKHGSTGTSLSLFVPSNLGYGEPAQQGETVSIPPYGILHFEFQIQKVEQP